MTQIKSKLKSSSLIPIRIHASQTTQSHSLIVRRSSLFNFKPGYGSAPLRERAAPRKTDRDIRHYSVAESSDVAFLFYAHIACEKEGEVRIALSAVPP